MPRFALLIEYDGTDFVGWQRQPVGVSAQQVLEDAAQKLVPHPVASFVAGRTDAGVHAAGQVAHIDLDRDIAPDALTRALNFHMKPHLLAVRQAVRVDDDFHARFSAKARHYRYLILNRPSRPALQSAYMWHVPHPLDHAAMHEAAQTILGRHDFSSFRAASCQAKSPLRTLDVLTVAREGDIISITAQARSFLHHQVRNLVGSLKYVGDGRWKIAQLARVLAACDRAQAGPTAPPEGLCLTQVVYDPDPFTI